MTFVGSPRGHGGSCRVEWGMLVCLEAYAIVNSNYNVVERKGWFCNASHPLQRVAPLATRRTPCSASHPLYRVAPLVTRRTPCSALQGVLSCSAKACSPVSNVFVRRQSLVTVPVPQNPAVTSVFIWWCSIAIVILPSLGTVNGCI